MLKLYLDEDVPEDIAITLRLRGYDVKTTKEAGNKGISDAEQLKYAASEGRILFSCNIADFYLQHNEFIRKGIEHRGIILSKQRPIGIITKALLKMLAHIKPDNINNNILWLSEWVD